MSINNQTVILVDEHDNFLGYEQRKKCHTGQGIHHRAFVVLLENKKGEVLMQKRKHELWDNFWDVTAISHPLHLKPGDETYADAGKRALRVEMGIEGAELENIGGFNYFAAHGNMCENEYCTILVGKYDGTVDANPSLVYEHKWIAKQKFITECQNNNQNYTPWAILTGKFIHEI